MKLIERPAGYGNMYPSSYREHPPRFKHNGVRDGFWNSIRKSFGGHILSNMEFNAMRVSSTHKTEVKRIFGTIKHDTGSAVLIVLNEEKTSCSDPAAYDIDKGIWIPTSQVKYMMKAAEGRTEDDVMDITAWIAKKKGIE